MLSRERHDLEGMTGHEVSPSWEWVIRGTKRVVKPVGAETAACSVVDTRLVLTGGTGFIGSRIIPVLLERGDEITTLSRSPQRVGAKLGTAVQAVSWDPEAGPAPAQALRGRDAVVNLAGESVAQRWTADAKRRIHASREVGTRNLVAGVRALEAGERPGALISASAVGYYGKRGDERLTEQASPGADFLAETCVAWEREADAAGPLGLRVCKLRTGIVLDADEGALATQLRPFKLGLGGPVAGGHQYVPWIHVDDLVGLYLAAIDGDWSGPFNGSAPEPVTNWAFAKALGRAVHRPAIAPIPGAALRLLLGEMAGLVTNGQRAVPAAALSKGHEFRFADLDAALVDVVG